MIVVFATVEVLVDVEVLGGELKRILDFAGFLNFHINKSNCSD